MAMAAALAITCTESAGTWYTRGLNHGRTQARVGHLLSRVA